MNIPFATFLPMERELDAELRSALNRVFERSWYIGGKEDEAFEKAFSDYIGTKYCVGVGNGLFRNGLLHCGLLGLRNGLLYGRLVGVGDRLFRICGLLRFDGLFSRRLLCKIFQKIIQVVLRDDIVTDGNECRCRADGDEIL